VEKISCVSCLPRALQRTVDEQFGECPRARQLFERFLDSGDARHEFHEDLIRCAAGEDGGGWDLRCAAALMLDREFLALRRNNGACDELSLKIQKHRGEPGPIVSAAHLRRRISRLARVFRRLRGLQTEPERLLDFIHMSRQPCKLTLARYLFDPDHVAKQVRTVFRESKGIAHIPRDYPEWAGQAWRYRNRELPPYESAILDQLAEESRIYWVDENTPATVNSIAEYPLGTVAAVVKPPGSDLEFEIKRVGVRGANPLDVVFARGEQRVPWSHRLHGGSVASMLDAESASSAKIAEIYRAAHGKPAPVSIVVNLSSIRTVPGPRGDEHLLPYLTRRDAFGDAFHAMREHMQRSVHAFEGENADTVLKGDLGLTVRFLKHAAPRQAILAGSTSFRLRTLEQYFAPDGDAAYFSGLGIQPTVHDSRRFADSLLEEILGVVHPPHQSEGSYAAYLDAAFADRRNRQRADRSYLSLLSQIGIFWGTLLAVGAFSYGESFVDRNVGIRSLWTPTGWQPRMRFMDHDMLTIPGRDDVELTRMIDGMRADEWYILGKDPGLTEPLGEVLCLNRIYRPSGDLRQQGAKRLRAGIESSYAKTRKARTRIAALSEEYRRAFSDWEETVRRFLSASDAGMAFDSWRGEEESRLRSKGYSPARAREIADSAKYGEDFFRRYGFIYKSQRRFQHS